jgi:hypothetical protein
MPILYEDYFQSDIDLCHVLDPGDDNPSTPPLHPAPTSVVVDDNDYYPLLDQDPRRWVDISQPTNDSANAGPWRQNNATEDPHHIFILCKAFSKLTEDACREMVDKTKQKIQETGLEEAQFTSSKCSSKNHLSFMNLP